MRTAEDNNNNNISNSSSNKNGKFALNPLLFNILRLMLSAYANDKNAKTNLFTRFAIFFLK